MEKTQPSDPTPSPIHGTVHGTEYSITPKIEMGRRFFVLSMPAKPTKEFSLFQLIQHLNQEATDNTDLLESVRLIQEAKSQGDKLLQQQGKITKAIHAIRSWFGNRIHNKEKMEIQLIDKMLNKIDEDVKQCVDEAQRKNPEVLKKLNMAQHLKSIITQPKFLSAKEAYELADPFSEPLQQMSDDEIRSWYETRDWLNKHYPQEELANQKALGMTLMQFKFTRFFAEQAWSKEKIFDYCYSLDDLATTYATNMAAKDTEDVPYLQVVEDCKMCYDHVGEVFSEENFSYQQQFELALIIKDLVFFVKKQIDNEKSPPLREGISFEKRDERFSFDFSVQFSTEESGPYRYVLDPSPLVSGHDVSAEKFVQTTADMLAYELGHDVVTDHPTVDDVRYRLIFHQKSND